MAGPLLNMSIFTRSTYHTLRAISLAVFPPAFIILLIQGIVSSDVNPAIGILPLFFSSAFSALLLANERKCGCQASGLTGTPIHLVFDVLLAVALLVCLILDWVFLEDSRAVMLGTYGTNFLICNFLIHTYFVAKQLQSTLSPGLEYPLSCPQCQHRSFSVGNIKLGPGLRNGYAPLIDEERESGTATERGRSDEGESMA